METLVGNVKVGRVRRERRGGRDYLVAPMSLIVSGVLAGSNGPLYYPPEEIAASTNSWNKIPLVAYHPIRNGQNVSASDPGILDDQGIGFILKARGRNGLKAEGWFDVLKTQEVDQRIHEALLHNRPMEISTGLFTENDPAPPGARDPLGRSYSFIARNYKPDHVAVLPDQIGACSINDGCGLLVNSSSYESLTTNHCGCDTVSTSEEDKFLGADAAEQKLFGRNPPNWAVDEDSWERAKEAASKNGHEEDWPYVVEIYKSMGGEIVGGPTGNQWTSLTTNRRKDPRRLDEDQEDDFVINPQGNPLPSNDIPDTPTPKPIPVPSPPEIPDLNMRWEPIENCNGPGGTKGPCPGEGGKGSGGKGPAKVGAVKPPIDGKAAAAQQAAKTAAAVAKKTDSPSGLKSKEKDATAKATAASKAAHKNDTEESHAKAGAAHREAEKAHLEESRRMSNSNGQGAKERAAAFKEAAGAHAAAAKQHSERESEHRQVRQGAEKVQRQTTFERQRQNRPERTRYARNTSYGYSNDRQDINMRWEPIENCNGPGSGIPGPCPSGEGKSAGGKGGKGKTVVTYAKGSVGARALSASRNAEKASEIALKRSTTQGGSRKAATEAHRVAGSIHSSASLHHAEAAIRASQEGKHSLAKEHERRADYHIDKSTAHHEAASLGHRISLGKSGTRNEANIMLNTAQRNSLVNDLINNTNLWRAPGDRDLLFSMSDEKLVSLRDYAIGYQQASAVANIAATGFTDGRGNAFRVNPKTGKWEYAQTTNAPKGEEEDDEEEMKDEEDDEEDVKKPATNRYRRTGRTQTMDQYIRGLPPELQQSLQVAREVEKREKDAIISKLLVNVADSDKRAQYERLITRSVEDLRTDLALLPRQPSPEEAGALSTTNRGHRSRAGEPDDMLGLPAINWDSKTGDGTVQRGTANASTEGLEDLSDEEALQQLPPHLRSAVQNATRIVDGEKRVIIEKLTENVADDEALARISARLERKTLEELKDLLQMQGGSVGDTVVRPNYFGAGSVPLNGGAFNAANGAGDSDDVLPLPKIDWAENAHHSSRKKA